ncbi:MAG: glutamate ligase domain-containing protein, partial [Flavobacteriaceae bacterium]
NSIVIKNLNKSNMIATSQFPFQGRHNLLNAMAAATAAHLAKIQKDTIRQSLLNFKGAPHRLEPVLNIQKVAYINDSKATNVNATYFALDSMDCPTVWIAGGVDKGNDYTSLLPLVNKNVKALICLGVDNRKLLETFSNAVPLVLETQSMSEAVKMAHKIAERKEAVLLSPACASFDLFQNYEDRGDQFKAAVRNL